jgi:hypothetical protein
MSLYSQFKTNANRERAGIRVEYRDFEKPDEPVPTFIVARAGGSNVAYNKALERETKPLRRAIATGNVPVATLLAINRKVFVETCLLGWENITSPAGDPIPFSQEAANTLFTDLPDLYTDLEQQSNSANLFRDNLESDSKN